MISEKDLLKEEEDWKKNKPLLERKAKIEKDKQRIENRINNKNKLTTTKLIIVFLFINCTIIELFTGWTTVQSIHVAFQTGYSPDFSPLTTLIGTVVGEIIGFAIYAAKSAKENCENGITYMKAKYELQQSYIDNTPNNNKEDGEGAVG